MATSQFLTLRRIIIAYKFFLHNGKILPISNAVVPLNSVEYSYGFGVYESLRVVNGKVLFGEEHSKRLMESAKIIGLEHQYNTNLIKKYLTELLSQNQVEACNIKVLLIGGNARKPSDIYLLCLNPLYPDRKLYRDGVKCITKSFERPFPHAKTLNMLQSYMAYRDAKTLDAYDALALNHSGFITEGTRTNFFATKGKTLFSPPENDILLGVTRDHVIEVANNWGFKVRAENIRPDQLSNFDGAFLTSTSSKIMPIRQVDNFSWAQIDKNITELRLKFDEFLISETAS